MNYKLNNMKYLTTEQLKKKAHIELVALAQELGISNAMFLTEKELIEKLTGKAEVKTPVENTKFQTKDFTEYDEETIKTLGIKKGQLLYIVEFASGRGLNFKQYEVYTEKGCKNAMDDMFKRGVMAPSVFNYLLMRFARLNDVSKHAISFAIYDPDEDSVYYDLMPNYSLSLVGTFKNGVFDGKIRDSLISYLTDGLDY